VAACALVSSLGADAGAAAAVRWTISDADVVGVLHSDDASPSGIDKVRFGNVQEAVVRERGDGFTLR